MTFANLLYFAEISGQQKPIFLSWNFSRDLRLPVAMTSLVYAVSPSTQACAVTSTNSCERGTQLDFAKTNSIQRIIEKW